MGKRRFLVRRFLPSRVGRRDWRDVLARIVAGIYLVCLASLGTPQARAELQFDVFMGYGDVVREAGWFPVSFELHNDGPSFDGVIEVTSGQLGATQRRTVAVELPTNTRKRVTIPAFASAGRNASWDVRLVDSRGKVRAERLGVRPADLIRESVLVGAISRSEAGLPSFPPIRARREEMQPKVSRIPLDFAPDNPLAYEGLSAVYLSSARAVELKAPQAAALVSWVESGGHLVVSVDQPGDFQATPWLRRLSPMELTSMSARRLGGEMQRWVGRPLEAEEGGLTVRTPGPGPRGRGVVGPGGDPYATLAADVSFDSGEIPMAGGRLVHGRVLVAVQGQPAVVQAVRGRGLVTLLTFGAEREPFKSWKNRPWFWARLLQAPPAWFVSPDFNAFGGWSADGIFGAMIDSRQIRKLPVEWLLALLVIYLVVIGPFDQWWLKKINRQMWTWVTFPAYVVVFSFLIYFIGFKLRHGEAEWNELHVVDLLPKGEKAEWRGRSYYSIYSPVNARYRVASELPFSSLRGEFQGYWRGGQESSSTSVQQGPNGYEAELSVPVWTSQMFVGDWWQEGEAVLAARVTRQGGQIEVRASNRLGRNLTNLRLVHEGRVYDLGVLPGSQTTTFKLEVTRGRVLADFVLQNAGQMQQIVASRQHTFGNNQRTHWDDLPLGAAVASFIGQMDARMGGQRQFVHPPGLDLGPVLERGQSVLLAWDAGQSLTKGIHRFDVKRGQRNTLLRLALTPGAEGSLN